MSTTETSRRPKDQRPIDPNAPGRDGEAPLMRRIWVNTSKLMDDAGLSVVEAKEAEGYVKVPGTERSSGRGFFMEIPQEKWEREIRDKARQRNRAQKGLRPLEKVGKSDLVGIDKVEAETFLGQEVMEAAAAASASNEHDG